MLGLILCALVDAGEMIEVAVARHDLAPGTTIGAEDLRNLEIPPDYVPNAVLREPAQALGRTTRERILAGEAIREERLADPECAPGLNGFIPRGTRVVDLALPRTQSWPLPQDLVDVVRPTGPGAPCLVATAYVPAVREPSGDIAFDRAPRSVHTAYLILTPGEVPAFLATSGPILLLRDVQSIANPVLPRCPDLKVPE